MEPKYLQFIKGNRFKMYAKLLLADVTEDTSSTEADKLVEDWVQKQLLKYGPEYKIMHAIPGAYNFENLQPITAIRRIEDNVVFRIGDKIRTKGITEWIGGNRTQGKITKIHKIKGELVIFFKNDHPHRGNEERVLLRNATKL